MNRNNKKLLKIVFFILMVYFASQNFHYLVSEDQLDNLEITPIVNEHVNSDECGLTWLNLENKYFFKRSAAFYLMQNNKIRLFFITGSAYSNKMKFTLKITIKNIESKSILFEKMFQNEVEIIKPWNVFNYASSSLEMNFNLKSIIDESKNEKYKDEDYLKNNLEMTATIGSIDHFNDDSLSTIRIKIKTQDKKKLKKGNLLCCKCIYAKAEDASRIDWWIRLNKRIGYHKIDICNQTIENSDELNTIFKNRNDNFIIMSHLK
jgi:hypothetical protein